MLSTLLIYSPLLSLIELEDVIDDRLLWEEALVVEGDNNVLEEIPMVVEVV